ncbi:MAG: hypothetical protein OXE75_17105 [bacterium]|nr:hypothetical protein [bacterium]
MRQPTDTPTDGRHGRPCRTSVTRTATLDRRRARGTSSSSAISVAAGAAVAVGTVARHLRHAHVVMTAGGGIPSPESPLSAGGPALQLLARTSNCESGVQ